MQKSGEKSPLESHLVACVQEYLSLYLYENAIFLAERLAAEFPSEGSVYLLSTCYHRAGQSYRAYHLLKGLQSPQSRYLFAVCAVQMGRLAEAEATLVPENDMARIPNGASGYYLLGRIYQLSNRHSVAIAYFNRALQLDPMMWQSFEELCSLGAGHETTQYINARPPVDTVGEAGAVSGSMNQSTPQMVVQAAPKLQGGQAKAGLKHQNVGSSLRAESKTAMPLDVEWRSLQSTVEAMEKKWRTEPPLPSSADRATFMADAAEPAATGIAPADAAIHSLVTPPQDTACITPDMIGPRLSRPPPAPRNNGVRQPAGAPADTPSALAHSETSSSLLRNRKFLDEGKMRKVSSKLFVEPASVLRNVTVTHTSTATKKSCSAVATQERDQNDAAGLAEAAAVAGVPRGERSQEGQAAAVALLQLLGEGYRCLCALHCREAIDAFSRLPTNHFQTGWVLMAVGRAYAEMVDYHSAARAFHWAQQVDPYRLQGLEIYSTVLWHMKSEVELATLAQDAVALDRHSPYAWCIVGNCFSLQKEHDAALRFFQRALQLDPSLAYAYTLCGHEYFTNEDFDKGVTCYRNAIRIDPRHYNAWFGMGMIYFRQEKYPMAEYHFRRAQTINARSSVLQCYLGMALAKLKRNAEALESLTSAVEADPHNPLARFEKAALLQASGAPEEALAELKALQDVAPREASVLFQMGKVLKKLGRTQEAMQAFSTALDLQPPSADTNLIKSAIDRVAVSDAEEEAF